jgi:thiamine biosynthesis lipoprotein
MRWVEDHWGTKISVQVEEPVPDGVLDELRTWFERVDRLFSTWRPDSEVMRLADGTLAYEQCSSEVHTVLAACEEVRIQSDGAFDMTVGVHSAAAPAPGRAPIDPSGFVKGWAVERAADLLAGHGYENFWIGAGGDVLTRGRPAPDRRWRVGVQHPWERGKVADVVELERGGVATSGRYERGDHVLDPRTGQPATTWMSVTVVGPDLGLADAYGTAAMAMGPNGVAWLDGLPGIEAMGIAQNGMVVATAGFPSIHSRYVTHPTPAREATPAP